MLEYDFLKVTSQLADTFKAFPIPVILLDQEFQVYWSNALARDRCPQLTDTRRLHEVLSSFDLPALAQAAQAQSGCTLHGVLPLEDTRLHLSSIRRSEAPTGLVLLVLGDDVLDHNGLELSDNSSQILWGCMHRALGELFSALDTASLKANLMNAGWLAPSFEHIGQHGYRILRMCDNIAHYSRYQSGTLDIGLQGSDLFSLLYNLRESVLAFSSQISIPVAFHLPQYSAVVAVDCALFETALLNILHNAMYYTRPHNHIEIAGEKRGSSVLVHVQDAGLGIPQEVQSDIVKPWRFYRHNRQQDTLGLGLSVARGILVAHGGSLELHSAQGEGTRVTMRLPESVFGRRLELAQDSVQTHASRFSRVHMGLADALLSPYL